MRLAILATTLALGFLSGYFGAGLVRRPGVPPAPDYTVERVDGILEFDPTEVRAAQFRFSPASGKEDWCGWGNPAPMRVSYDLPSGDAEGFVVWKAYSDGRREDVEFHLPRAWSTRSRLTP